MGHGYVTCALTRLPVTCEDECVMIDFTDCPLTPGQMFDELHKVKIIQILKGKYDDYGSLEGLKEDHDTKINTYRIFFLKEAWDKVVELYPRTLTAIEQHVVYANRAGNEIPYLEDSNTTVYIHEELRHTQNRLMHFGEFIEEWLSVKYFMDENRLNLDSWFNGYTQQDNLVAQLDLNKITRTIIDKRIIEYNEEIDDFDENDRDVFCYEVEHPSLQWKNKAYAEESGEKYFTKDS